MKKIIISTLAIMSFSLGDVAGLNNSIKEIDIAVSKKYDINSTIELKMDINVSEMPEYKRLNKERDKLFQFEEKPYKYNMFISNLNKFMVRITEKNLELMKSITQEEFIDGIYISSKIEGMTLNGTEYENNLKIRKVRERFFTLHFVRNIFILKGFSNEQLRELLEEIRSEFYQKQIR